MKSPLLPAFLTLALGCAFASEAVAQASYQTQIRTALQSAEGRVGLRNARRAGEPLMGVLNGGKTENRNVDLQAGVRYAIVGVCDASCTDIDLRIFGPGPAGAKVAEDVQQNATPTLEFTAPAAGRYRVSVEMVSCSEAPCAWGLQVLAAR